MPENEDAGTDETENENDAGSDDELGELDDLDDEKLGEAGKKALLKEREARKEDRKALRDAEAAKAKTERDLRKARATAKEAERRRKTEDTTDKADRERIAELEGRIKDLTEREQRARSREAFAKAGEKAGAKYPSEIYRLIDQDSVEHDDDGSPDEDAVADAVAALKGRMPELFGAKTPASADGGPRGSGVRGRKTDMESLLRTAAKGR